MRNLVLVEQVVDPREILGGQLVQLSIVTDNQEKDKSEAKTDKDLARNGRDREKSKSQSQQKSIPKKVKVKGEADIEEMLNGPTRTHLMGRLNNKNVTNPYPTSSHGTHCHVGNPMKPHWSITNDKKLRVEIVLLGDHIK
ncbi:hypothetical protein Tco_0096617 [Tanacetum coccineum]